ncbi:hypothetical protein OG279_37330 (plasmid) [Streptomyces sp. NBC_01201]|uniref:hypothetical protein n=1 Tax=Streptomyces sp. NBC_01201 TaxID=2903770 RepID=UPI002E142B67|nr:hypothetical protein OG279_37330 [Streptomyces sp. NBC_01201]
MEIIIKGADEKFAEKLVVLAAQHNAELSIVTADTRWTTDRAERYLRSLTSSALTFARMVILDGDESGFLDADRLRDALGKLNGPSNALTRAVPRGVREGWLPEGIEQPVIPVADRNNPSWHKTIAYQVSAENRPVFEVALDRILPHKEDQQP